MAKDKSRPPIPETEEERHEAVVNQAEQAAAKMLPGKDPDSPEMLALREDLKMEYGNSYPESRESRGR